MNIRPAILIIENNQLLVLKYNYSGNEVLALPGGNLEFGEYMQDALARELIEELNLEVSVNDLCFIAEVFRNNKNTIHFIFKGNIIHGKPTLNPAETTALDYEWVKIEDLAYKNLYPNIATQIIAKHNGQPSAGPFLGPIDQKWF